MEIPFLKNKNNQCGGGSIEREADGSTSMLRHITKEFLSAVHTKDEAGLEDALKAFILTIKDEDQMGDA